MLVGDLVATIRLDGAQQVNAQLAQTGAAMADAGAKAGSLGKVVGGAFAVAGNVVNTATAALGAMAAKSVTAGAAFNTLQQNTNVALTTLLGSSEAAQAQLSRLNDFTSKSPFGRDVFMKAQQQLLGFGVEATKVIPYLDAIQNAVAGIGGNDAQISQITTIIAKIRSSATLGQQDLLELGNAGINAAALIASATGRSEKEVRDSIFGNPLRGDEALAGLDAMMKGMSTRFQGTTDLLKQQMDGARDRVKASMRDIGAVLSAPIIDPKGGGWGVTLTNSYADILRGVQSAITPMVDELATRMGPAFLDIDGKMQHLASTIRQIDMADLRAGFAQVQPILPVVAGGLAALSAQGLGSIPVLRSLGLSFNPLVTGLAAAAAASPAAREAIGDILGALQPLVPVAGDVARILAGTLSSGMSALGAVVKAVAPTIELVANGIASIPAPMLAAATAIGVAAMAFRSFKTASDAGVAGGMFGAFASGTKAASDGIRQFGTQLTEMGSTASRAYAAGLSPTSAALAAVAPVASSASSGIAAVGNSLKAAFLSNPVGMVILGITAAIGAFSMASAEAEQKSAEWKSSVEELRGTLDKTSGAMTNQTQQMVVQNLQGTEWATRVSELANGTGKLGDMTTAIVGKNDAFINQLADLAAGQTDWNDRLTSGSTATNTLATMLEKTGTTQRDWIKAASGSTEAADSLREKFTAAGYEASNFDSVLERLSKNAQGINQDALSEIFSEQDKIATARALLIQAADAMADLKAKGGDAAVAQQRLTDALGTASDVAADASERIRALNSALDALNGGTATAAEQQQNLDDAVRSSADAWAQANASALEATGGAAGLAGAIVDVNGKIDTSTEVGSKFRDSMKDMATNMQTAALEAANLAKQTGGDSYSAALSAITPYVDQVRQLGKEYGLSDVQVNAMLASLNMLPEDVALGVSLDGKDEVSAELGGIALQLGSLGDGVTTLKVATLSDQAKAELTAIGYQVKQLADGSYEISVGADPKDAEARLLDLKAKVTGTSAAVILDADATAAGETLVAWKATADGTLALPTVGADTTPAADEVVAWKLQADGTWAVSNMNADTALADGSVVTWKQNADGTWSTAHVGAEASSAFSTVGGWKQSADGTWATAKVTASTSSAYSEVDSFVRNASGRVITIAVQTSGGGSGAAMIRANGGLDSYNGMESFAQGGFPTGLFKAKGTPMYKFAEPETGWEAFISGRPGQEDRNIGIGVEALRRLGADWEDVLSRLGMPPVRAFANGGVVGGRVQVQPRQTLVGDVYLDGRALVGEFRGVMSDTASSAVRSYDSDRSRTARHGRERGR